MPVEEIIGALDELVKAGKVRHIAASNISAERLRASLEFSDREGLARYVALQPHYNLVSRDTYEGELQDLAERAGLAAVPYYALASGFLTGKYRPGTTVDSARAGGAAKHLETERGRRVLDALDEIAAAHDVPVATVALAWLAAQPTVAAPIASARTVEQLPALVGVGELTLTEAEAERLTRGFGLSGLRGLHCVRLTTGTGCTRGTAWRRMAVPVHPVRPARAVPTTGTGGAVIRAAWSSAGRAASRRRHSSSSSSRSRTAKSAPARPRRPRCRRNAREVAYASYCATARAAGLPRVAAGVLPGDPPGPHRAERVRLGRGQPPGDGVRGQLRPYRPQLPLPRPDHQPGQQPEDGHHERRVHGEEPVLAERRRAVPHRVHAHREQQPGEREERRGACAGGPPRARRCRSRCR